MCRRQLHQVSLDPEALHLNFGFLGRLDIPQTSLPFQGGLARVADSLVKQMATVIGGGRTSSTRPSTGPAGSTSPVGSTRPAGSTGNTGPGVQPTTNVSAITAQVIELVMAWN